MYTVNNYEKEVISQAHVRRVTTEFINIVNDLWYDKSIELVFFRNPLVEKRASEILKLIDYAEEFVGKVFSNFEEKPQFLSNEEAEEMLHELWSAYKEGRLD